MNNNSFYMVLCEDINECSGPNDCQQQCVNTEGSYNCSCVLGFTLNTDGRSCNGMILVN